MKIQSFIYGLLLLFMVVACSTGPKGDIGPSGAKGTIGATGDKGLVGDSGAKGSSGDIANSNVVYTGWQSVDFKDPYVALLNRVQFDPVAQPFPLLTKEVLDNSEIFIYAKNRQLEVVNNQLQLIEYIHEVSSVNVNVSYYLFPGRSGLKQEDYGTHSIPINGQFLSPGILDIGPVVLRLGPGGLKLSTTVNETVPEMADKPMTFYKDFMKDLIKFRVIIVKGNVAGRQSVVDMNDYEAVKKAYNIPD